MSLVCSFFGGHHGVHVHVVEVCASVCVCLQDSLSLYLVVT